jgi:hypothetical protein
MTIGNLIRLIPTYRALYMDVHRQKDFIREVLLPDLMAAGNNNDGTLDEEDFRKIKEYYGLGVPAIVGEMFCTLRGTPMSRRERMASTYQGALTGLYDDFFDKTHLGTASIRQMMDDPHSFTPSSSLEKLFILFLIKVHNHLYNGESFREAFERVFAAQLESRNQAGDSLSTADIRRITFDKGGYSLLFYRSVFEHEPVEGEADALFHAGALMQLGNDIFDVWKDGPGQIKTLVTGCRNISEVREVFINQLHLTAVMIRKTAFRKENIDRLLHKLVMGISRCLVCLGQLEALQKKTDGEFRHPAYRRDEMLCDMQKPVNIIRSFRYYLGYKV